MAAQTQPIDAKALATLEWWTVREVANRWRKSDESVRRLIERGELKAMRCGGSYRIHTDTITAYERPSKPPAARKARKLASDPREVDLIGTIARKG